VRAERAAAPLFERTLLYAKGAPAEFMASVPRDEPPLLRSVRGSVAAHVKALEDKGIDRIDVPAFLRRQADATPARSAPARGTQRSTPRRLLATVRSRLIAPSEFDAVVRTLDRATPPEGVADALRALARLGLSRGEAWLLIVAWLAARFGDHALPGPDAMRAIDALVAALPAAARDDGMQIVGARMGTVTLEAW